MLYPIATEKAINMITKANTLTFVIDKDMKKEDVKKEIEEKFEVKIASVRVHYTFHGKKRAYVRLQKEFSAMDLASKLKIL